MEIQSQQKPVTEVRKLPPILSQLFLLLYGHWKTILTITMIYVKFMSEMRACDIGPEKFESRLFTLQ